MKRHVQVEGVRKWAGDHLVELQGEPLKILDRFFGQYGPFVLQGCAVTPAAGGGNLYDVAPGLVVLAGKDRNNADAVMIVPFAGITNVPLPLYLTLKWEVRRREYATGGVKPIAYDYYAEGSTVQPAAGTPRLILNDKTLRFVDVIQDAKHSFITEAERTRWNEILTIKPWVNELLAAFDPTRVGEHRLIRNEVGFSDPRYLPMDGSRVLVSDFTDCPFAFPSSIMGDVIGHGNSSANSVLIAYGNGVYNTISREGLITGSTDLMSWEIVESGMSGVLAAAYGNGVWVAVCNTPAVFRSLNGIDWTRVSSTLSFKDVAFGGGIFVATGSSGTYTSTDGSTWTRRTISSTLDTFAGKVAYSNGVWVLTEGGDSTSSIKGFVYSTNGVNWTWGSTPASISRAYPCNGYWLFSTHTTGQFYVYTSNLARVSTNTISSFTSPVGCIFYFDGKYVAFPRTAAGYKAVESTDLSTWVPWGLSPAGLTQNSRSVLYLDDGGVIINNDRGSIAHINRWYIFPNLSGDGYTCYLKTHEE